MARVRWRLCTNKAHGNGNAHMINNTDAHRHTNNGSTHTHIDAGPSKKMITQTTNNNATYRDRTGSTDNTAAGGTKTMTYMHTEYSTEDS